MNTAMPLPVSPARPPRSANSSTRSISISPESARPRTAGTSMPGCHSRPLAGARRVCANDLRMPSTCAVSSGAPGELADRGVQRRGQRAARSAVGPGLELAGAPAAAHGRRAQRVEQHGLADSAQAGEHDRALGRPRTTRSSSTSKPRSSASRPASSGGRWPAPGA